jgi:xylulokinase
LASSGSLIEGRAAIYVIGCDLGTSSLKAVAMDATGAPLARATVGYATSYPHPGWAEQDPRDWERAVRSAVHELTGRLGPEVEALGIAGQVDAVVPVDRNDRPLGPAPIWMDRRAFAEAAGLAKRVGSGTVREITGLNVDASHGAPKIAWLRSAPDDRATADAWLAPSQFLVATLTGERAMDHANASSTLLYDIRRRAWSPELLAELELTPDQLGTIAGANDVAGSIRADLASELGVQPACRVVVGTGDEHSACFAAGALEPGLVADISGTAEPVAAASTHPTIDPDGLVETHAHVLTDRWLVENPGFVSAGSVRWLAEAVLGVREQEVESLAAQVPPGAEGCLFIPALGGAVTPRWNDQARGTFHGLAIGHDRRHLARAVLEGCAFALRDIVERLDAMGLGGGPIRVVGGGARNSLWLRIKADVTGRAVERLEEPEATATGAALLAATAAGWFASPAEAVRATVRVAADVQEPDPALSALYRDAYRRYHAVFDALEPITPANPS